MATILSSSPFLEMDLFFMVGELVLHIIEFVAKMPIFFRKQTKTGKYRIRTMTMNEMETSMCRHLRM